MDVIYTLWSRQMKRYARSRSRIVGAFGQPVLLLLALGYGLGAVYAKAGQGDYLQFLVPGIIAQTLLLSGVFWGLIILQDKRFGFLAELLVAPVRRIIILFGSALGGTTVSMIQGTLVFIVALLLGFRMENWLLIFPALAVMLFMTLALTFFGAAIASMVEDFQGFQGVNNFLILPLFFLSSALYPLEGIPAFLKFLSTINPVTYMVDTLRHFLSPSYAHFNLGMDLLVVSITFVLALGFAVNRFNRIQM